MITLIAAISENNVIGLDNALPWSLPEDLKHFKKTTHGFPVIMGRSTFESLPRRPLPNRINIVLSRGDRVENGVFFVKNIMDAIAYAGLHSNQMFVIGGEDVYRQTIGIADRLIITHVKRVIDGNKFFPTIDPKIWCKINTISDNYDFEIREYLKK